MTNYNKRLDEIFAPLIDSPSLTLTTAYWDEAKAAITSLIKELIEQAKPPYYSVEEPGHNARHDGIEQYETNLKELLKLHQRVNQLQAELEQSNE